MADDARLAELRGLLAEALLGNPVCVIQRGPIVFVDATGPMTAKTAYSLADALAPVVSAWAEQDREQHAARRAAEELGEALGKAATLGPLEAVAWMARRHAALTPTTEEKR